jgi:hypothetical protein
VAKVAESVTWSWHFRPFSPAGLGFARYAVLAYFISMLIEAQRLRCYEVSTVLPKKSGTVQDRSMTMATVYEVL